MEKTGHQRTKIAKRKSTAMATRKQDDRIGRSGRGRGSGCAEETNYSTRSGKQAIAQSTCGVDRQHEPVVALSVGFCPRATAQFPQVQQCPALLAGCPVKQLKLKTGCLGAMATKENGNHPLAEA